MEIRENNKMCIYAPLNNILNKYESDRLFNDILKEKREIAIDLANVNDCTIDFIENLKQVAHNKKIGIFNIPSDIFVLFNTMKIDKCVELYVSELDFIESSRKLINREFSLIY